MFFSKKTMTAACGHRTAYFGTVEAHGKKQHFHFSGNLKNPPPFCLECLGKAIIQCAWCGEWILPDEPITLYTAKEGFEPPEGSRAFARTENGYEECVPDLFPNNKVYYVGCLSWNCCFTGADRAGFWRAPGYIEFALSPIEAAFMTGEVVIVSNINDSKEAVNLEKKVYEFQKKQLTDSNSPEN